MENKEKSTQVKAGKRPGSTEKLHKTLPKMHALSNKEMSKLEGGNGSRRNEKLGTISWTLGCP